MPGGFLALACFLHHNLHQGLQLYSKQLVKVFISVNCRLHNVYIPDTFYTRKPFTTFSSYLYIVNFLSIHFIYSLYIYMHFSCPLTHVFVFFFFTNWPLAFHLIIIFIVHMLKLYLLLYNILISLKKLKALFYIYSQYILLDNELLLEFYSIQYSFGLSQNWLYILSIASSTL